MLGYMQNFGNLSFYFEGGEGSQTGGGLLGITYAGSYINSAIDDMTSVVGKKYKSLSGEGYDADSFKTRMNIYKQMYTGRSNPMKDLTAE